MESYLKGSNGGVFVPSKLSLYIYSGHNPVRNIDPDGNDWVESGDGSDPYQWVDTCGSGQTCYTERAAAVDGMLMHYGANGQTTSYAPNDQGYFDIGRMSNFSGRKMLDTKAGNTHYMNLNDAANLYNTLSDYFNVYSNDSAFMFTESGNPDGSHVPGHGTHNFGRSADFRYKGSNGENLHDPYAFRQSDLGRMKALYGFARNNGFDQNYVVV